jgi:hypothetical protein
VKAPSVRSSLAGDGRPFSRMLLVAGRQRKDRAVHAPLEVAGVVKPFPGIHSIAL